MRIFIDSNIIISAALFPAGKASYVLSNILESHKVIIASYSVKECEAVFKKKFRDKLQYLKIFFQKIDYELFNTPNQIDAKKFPNIRDLKDLPILASAILSDADILITGDKDFDEIKLKRPLVFTPTQYYDLIKNNILK